jgi:hypothetical protein
MASGAQPAALPGAVIAAGADLALGSLDPNSQNVVFAVMSMLGPTLLGTLGPIKQLQLQAGQTVSKKDFAEAKRELKQELKQELLRELGHDKTQPSCAHVGLS